MESELESESIFSGRSRSQSRSRLKFVDSAALYESHTLTDSAIRKWKRNVGEGTESVRDLARAGGAEDDGHGH